MKSMKTFPRNIKLNIYPTTDNGNFRDIGSNWVRYIFSFFYFKKIKRRTHTSKGDQLGVGCFGRVVKAEAVGLKDSDETVKTVAVKMVRSATNDAEMEALIRELKILIYLGSHFNVVNLLGACTKRASRGLRDFRIFK